MTEIADIDFTSDTLMIDADHPSLAGHFPGNPVVPGVVELQIVNDVLQARLPHWQLCGIPQAKFLSPLLPGEEFVIRLHGRLPRIEFHCCTSGAGRGRVIAKGVLELQAQESADA